MAKSYQMGDDGVLRPHAVGWFTTFILFAFKLYILALILAAICWWACVTRWPTKTVMVTLVLALAGMIKRLF